MTAGEPGSAPDREARDERQPRERRPIIERIGMAAIAAVLAALFGGVAVAAWVGGELFLAVMGGIGCLMTAWVGGLTLFRG
ncbi:MAG: hypothetical protein ABIP77_03010 [Candidatus Limnocylindrales bacterium]